MSEMVSATEHDVTWQEAMTEFLAIKQASGVRPATLQGYRNHIERFFRQFRGTWNDEQRLKRGLIKHLSENVSPYTYNLRLVYLRAFLDWCVSEQYLSVNPLKQFKSRKTSERIVDIPDETLQQLLRLPDLKTYCGLRDYALILLTLDTGIRPAEAFRLKPADIDIKTRQVTIREDVSKTGLGRTLYILPETAKSIQKLLHIRPANWANAPLFCKEDGQPMDRHCWNKRIKKYAQTLGINLRPYDLRHAFAIRFLRNGGNVFALQRILGHTDMSMTKRYVYLTQNDLRDVHAQSSPVHKLLPKKTRIRRLDK
ncbi:tyrosine recombinase XerD [Caldalkalibacillus thermarum]|uniref:tyrosine-type recombinase/integrase n=1 Tax=Caldalkalibacillus thermarum TaxID=296745 RepID=UPI00166C0B54|nr:tyrosine-type recombinase/integrase [Caldalkalibacillus thermarum]GGK31670.1 tyrosine recombinase XerD [Caldalkalibacillus thermarum]